MFAGVECMHSSQLRAEWADTHHINYQEKISEKKSWQQQQSLISIISI
jgi:hypothetical protein